MVETSLFLFTQDLRLHDNTALIKATNESNQVVLCYYIGNNPQIIKKKQPFWFQFLMDSLRWLKINVEKNEGKLYILYGDLFKNIKTIQNTTDFDAIYLNRQFSSETKQITQLLKSINLPIHISQDYLLHKPETILTKSKKPYEVFTPFFKHSQALPLRTQKPILKSNFFSNQFPTSHAFDIGYWIDERISKSAHFQGGRDNALKILNNLKKYAEYEMERDIPSIKGTTSLSAHLNFGTCSIRETYELIVDQLGIDHPLVRQLFWREFFVYIGVHYPHVFKGNFRKKYDALQWSYNKTMFQKWKDGMTGFPIIDAGMRQLNETGFMHNRVRMIVGSFLTKDLQIDWKWGEQYFQEKLTDYDPMLNNGNWQWVAGTGCDAAPYFRIFNPWTQQKKFDPECIYIKRWIPELQDVPIIKIHNIYKKSLSTSTNYPKPMVNHAKARVDTLAMYKAV